MNKEETMTQTKDLIKRYQDLKDKSVSALDKFKSNGSTHDIKKVARLTESIYQYTCFIGSLKDLEELEAPVTGVTDEINTIWESGKSTVNKKLLDKIKDEVTMALTGHKWEDTPDRFKDIYVNIAMNRYLDAVTGNKPGKTEEEIEKIVKQYMGLGSHVDKDKLHDEMRAKLDFGMWCFTEGANSTPIDTLGKEELLKQAKDNAAKNMTKGSYPTFKELFQEGHPLEGINEFDNAQFVDDYVDEFAEEYLRLCTGKE